MEDAEIEASPRLVDAALLPVPSLKMLTHPLVILEEPCGRLRMGSIPQLASGLLQQTRRKHRSEIPLTPVVPKPYPPVRSARAYAVNYRSHMVTCQG